jgi:hypothetical protein
VYCGHSILPWELYRQAADAFWGRDSDPHIRQGPASFPQMSEIMQRGDESLLEVMRTCRKKLSENPRDKVFGILGLLPEATQREFPVDYSQSVKTVYTDVVDYLISTTDQLDVIRESIHFPIHVNTTGLPTWYPDCKLKLAWLVPSNLCIQGHTFQRYQALAVRLDSMYQGAEKALAKPSIGSTTSDENWRSLRSLWMQSERQELRLVRFAHRKTTSRHSCTGAQFYLTSSKFKREMRATLYTKHSAGHCASVRSQQNRANHGCGTIFATMFSHLSFARGYLVFPWTRV